GTSEQAVSKGEERTGIPLLPTLRQGVSRGYSEPRLSTGESQSRCARGGWGKLRRHRDAGFGGVDERAQGGTAEQDIQTTTGATGNDPEARRRRATARNTDNSGSGGADRCEIVAGTDLGSGSG